MWVKSKEFEMERAYLLIAGVLTGAAVGLLTGHVTVWLCIGVAMGVVMSASVRRRPRQPAEPPVTDSRRPTADGRF
jgi:hypothetical protein